MEAYFVFEQESPDGKMKQFIFQLDNPTKIEEARRILRNGESLKVHVQGTIIPRPVAYNPDWSFHLDPKSIGFFEMQMEVCDANVTLVEKHLDEIGGSFLPRCFWCPWSSKLMAEINDTAGRRE
ncbi:hypothetical protein [Caballeronia sp. AZ7_KS35]|uniref:BP74-related protein n=1 Tax=Caballeronia sp. AZ7_KS35 TaxID=2921762 RepID=UPI0020290097|nr:hypothetical protein [Caballeronia sp. AZ7_KS35]